MNENAKKILLVTGVAVAVAGTALYLAQAGAPPPRRRLARRNPSASRSRTRTRRRKSKYAGYVVQAVLVPKTHRDVRNATRPRQAAQTVANRHGGQHALKVEESRNYFTFRLADPREMTKSYVSLRLPSGTIIRKALPKAVSRRMAA